MTTRLLEKTDTAYKEIKKRREELRQKELELREELGELHAQGRSDWTDKQREVRDRLHAIAEERQSLEGPYALGKRAAQQEAFTRITKSTTYRRQVKEAAQVLAEAVPSWLALEATIMEARRGGLGLLPTPARLLVEAKAWVKRAIAADALDVADLPPSLRGLLEEGE